ncbi:Hypothetical protein PP7435_CHR1-0116 [Komagataella phaffii CBS 7435]|uniref:Uncharacterized protein n=1 Tax=Komagataella phaffii (strain ATCC 76273 / CBS 7435 / CECT 11047 / NRRL Y-11430 / Wegner 21-1) TaxID=981350 RepID=F2QLZ5_KOMPC|nr:Hypothetical protein BQ9382_C1-0600 [Komagataella phaffii CBS 7435]CCA36283.1 Hypothetical protein PP7435_CHR1-0116 [Komagataella phaffii CBS 7435]
MQFSTVAIASILAAAVSAETVVATVKEVSTTTSTDTDCAETVTDCPAHKTYTHSQNISNHTVSTISKGAAAGLTGGSYVVGAALVAGAAVLGL